MRRAACLLLMLASSPAVADHPGADRLDGAMAGKEPAFQATDLWDIPDPDLVTEEGRKLSLDALADRVIVLSFVPEECGRPCAAQQTVLRKVEENIGATAMREMVSFVIVGAEEGPPAAGDAANRLGAAPRSGSVADLAESLAALSDGEGGAPLVHIIDRGGRHAATFQGSGFDPLNATLYINGLTNAQPTPRPGFLERLMGMFR